MSSAKVQNRVFVTRSQDYVASDSIAIGFILQVITLQLGRLAVLCDVHPLLGFLHFLDPLLGPALMAPSHGSSYKLLLKVVRKTQNNSLVEL